MTLALVITIIILLILAGVAISMITGGEGLFAKANDAATKYNQAAKNEADLINQLLGGEYLKGEETRQLSDMVKDGTIKVGDWIDYPIELGTGTNNGYFTMAPEQTGWQENQTYNVTNYTDGWRVLYVNTETGEIEIISNSNLLANDETTTLTLYGYTGYENIVKTLNKMASYYVNDKYVMRARAVHTNSLDSSCGNNVEIGAGFIGSYKGQYDWEALELVPVFNSGNTWYAYAEEDYFGGSGYQYHGGMVSRRRDGPRYLFMCETKNDVDFSLKPAGYESLATAEFMCILALKPEAPIKLSQNSDGSSQEKAWKLK